MTIPTDQIAATLDLLRAAMESKEHVFVEWFAHIETVRVKAIPAGTNYQIGGYAHLIDEDVYLGTRANRYDDSDPLPRLRELAERVRGLG